MAYVLTSGTTLTSQTAVACVIGYPLGSSGPLAPSVSITLPTGSNIQYEYQGLAVDAAGNIYVGSAAPGNPQLGQVLVFVPGANGAAVPARTIAIPPVSNVPGVPNDVAVHSTGNLYVATTNDSGVGGSTILEFAAGSEVPTRTIGVSSSPGCSHLAADNNGNVVCTLTEQRQILVFGSMQSGNVAPARTLSDQVEETVALALDPAGNIWLTQSAEINDNLNEALLEFAGGDGSGTSRDPIATISGTSLPNNENIQRIGFDAAGNLYAYQSGTAVGSVEAPTIALFVTGTNGFAAPVYGTLTSYPVLFDPGVTGFVVSN